jgi:tetratricopeptide (TPR) repeat protein
MQRRQFVLAGVFAVSFCCTIYASSVGSEQIERSGKWTKETQNSPDLKAARKQAEAKPKDAVAQNDYGWALRMNGDSAQGLEYLKKAAELDPSLAYVHSNLSVAQLDLKKPQEALVEGKKAVDMDAKQPIFHVVYGNALLANENAKGAIAEYNSAIALRPDYQNAYFNLGRAYQKSGQLTEAKEALSKALELDPKDERVIKLMDEIWK